MAKSNTKKVEIEVPEVFSAHLAAFLHNNPHVKKVWVNEAGEYHLSAKEGFDEYDVDDNLKPLEEYPVAPSPDAGTIEQLKKELEEAKAEIALLKEALAKAPEPNTQQ
ncbi:MAG TPA: hypothetical protein VG605_04185 [Puia sp.]|nr:hypothetical protein [Puia sp.]